MTDIFDFEKVKNDSELQDILALCSVSTKMTAKTLFPDRFFANFAENIHEPIFELIDSDAPRVVIAAPRGFGKTSIVGLALAGKSILFRQRRFIPFVSVGFDAAVEQTENLKMELATNPAITSLFGRIKAKNAAGFDESFSKKAWIALNTMVYPRGSGQRVRGMLYRNSRPDLIIIDDLEDPETIENEDIRRKRKEWFFGDLMKAVSRLEKGWKVVYIDTLKHEDSLLQLLLESKDWEGIRLEAFDDNYDPTAPEFMDKEEIMKERDSHKEKGILDVFFREYRNLPIATEDASFKAEHFQYYDEPELDKTTIETILLVDPAKTAKMQSSDSALVVVGLDYETCRIYVRDIVAGKMYPDELYDHMFLLKARYNIHTIGIEVTGLEEFIKQPIKNEIVKRGPMFAFEPIWLKARGGPADSGNQKGKAKRIAALVPFYRQGYIFHNKHCCDILESQLLMFPRSKRWDVMDAFAYVIEMMELGERYFNPPTEDPKDIEAEYKELEDEYDDALDGAWRMV